MGNVGSFSKMQVDSEKEVFNTIINKVYSTVSSYLNKMDINPLLMMLKMYWWIL